MTGRSDFATSVIRTGVGYLVAWLLSLPAAPALESAAGVTAGGAKTLLTGLFVFVVGTGWYALARQVEARWPKAGALLGVPRAPVYDAAPARVGQSAEAIAAQTGAQLVDAEPSHSAP